MGRFSALMVIGFAMLFPFVVDKYNPFFRLGWRL